MKSSEFVFDYMHLLYYKCHKINPNRGGSYIDFPDWIKNKKATINSVNKKDNNCFQYAVTVTLNHEEIKKDPHKITKIKPFIIKYNCEGINFPSGKDDWKALEKNNVTIALNVVYVKKEKIYPAYVSKHNSNRILLLISNGEGWHYLVVLKTISVIKGSNVQTSRGFYCLNCLHSFATENKRESHKTASENKNFCNLVMASEDTKILELNQYQKSGK